MKYCKSLGRRNIFFFFSFKVYFLNHFIIEKLKEKTENSIIGLLKQTDRHTNWHLNDFLEENLKLEMYYQDHIYVSNGQWKMIEWTVLKLYLGNIIFKQTLNASYVPFQLSPHSCLLFFSVNEIKMKLMSGVFLFQLFFLELERKKKSEIYVSRWKKSKEYKVV